MGRSFTPQGGASTPFEGQELLSSFTPPPLQASVNDYTVNVRGFANASVLQVSATTAVNVTGLQGATANRELTLINVGASAITLKNASVASLAANRFQLGADLVLNQNSGVKLLGLAAGGWAAVGGGGGGGAGPAPSTATYVTTTDESAVLPNSVTLASQASGAFIYATANQSIANATATLMDVDTVIFDTDGYFDPGTPNVLTVPTAGVYVVTASALWNTNGTGTVILSIAHNGDLTEGFGYNAQANTAVVNVGQSVSVVLSLAAGDTVGALVEQTSGGALNLLAFQRFNQISIARVQ